MDIENLQNERIVLGSMMVEREAIIKASAIVKAEDFNEPDHREIYNAIIEMFNKNKPVELVSLSYYLKDKKKKIPASYLKTCLDRVSTTATVEYYARQVKDIAVRRKYKNDLLQTISGLDQGKGTSEAIKDLSDRLKTLSTEVEFEEFKYDTDSLHQVADELQKRHKNYTEGQKITGLKTGFEHFDNLINGLQTGLYILGAPPTVGKTTFCKQLADQVAVNNQVPVIFISYEQSAFEMIIKTLSRFSSTDSFKLQKGNINRQELVNLTQAENKYREHYAPYIITVEGNTTTYIDKIRTYALRAMTEKEKSKCLVVIDYLQLVPTRESYKDKRTQVDLVLSDLRRLARELDSPVWAVSSFARVAYRPEGGKPALASFKESGGIEYTADLAVLMESEQKEITEKTRTVNFRVCKHRNGATGKIVFEFTPSVSKFEEVGKEDLEQEYII